MNDVPERPMVPDEWLPVVEQFRAKMTKPLVVPPANSEADPIRRRARLLLWLWEREEHRGLRAREIADMSDIYDRLGHGRVDRCFDDLIALHRQQYVVRSGRPARWFVVPSEGSEGVSG